MPVDLLLALAELVVVLVFALIAIALKTIDRRGFLASVIVGFSIIYGGGWMWFAVIATFFIVGVGFTFYKYEHKRRMGAAQDKGGSRNWPNIIANGGVASVLAVMNLAFGSPIFVFLFLGAMSAAASDTVATELGLLSHSQPRLITNPYRAVTPGTSGGVTMLGFLGAFLAAGVIGMLAFLLGLAGGGAEAVMASVFGGVIGAAGDSVLGALVQRRGRCVICDQSTEKLVHCGKPTDATGGVSFIENNVVNLLATLVGAAAAGLFFFLY